MKRFIPFILLLLNVFHATPLWSLGSPDLRCLQVEADGSVQLTWLTPTDISNFQQYEIFYSYNNSSFTLAGTTLSPNYVHLINADIQPTIYYYVEAVSTLGSRYRSQTLSTIEFYLTNPGSGRALLNWLPPVTPLLPSYNNNYHVEIKRYFETNFSTRFTVLNHQLSCTDIIDICNGNIAYRISLEDMEAGCFNVSRIQSDIFSDMTDPEKPTLDSVSVNFTTGLTHLGWTPSPSTDVCAYIIYFYDTAYGWLSVDTVFGYNNTSWIDMDNMPGTGSGQYRIVALDSCMNSSPMTDFQQTMILSGTLDDCGNTIALSWNGYQHMSEGILGYNVYYSLNGAPVQFAATTSATHYTFHNILPENNYNFIVQAINSTGMITATSKAFGFYSGDPPSEYQLYFRYASVVDNANIELKIFTNGDTLPFSKLYLYRSISRNDNFSLLTELFYNGAADYQFVDTDVDVANTTYYYYAEIFNTCDNPSKISNTVQNFLLKGENFGERIHRVKWSTPEGWEVGVDHFIIERKKQVDLNFEDIDTQYPSIVNEYDDDVEELYEGGSDFFYRITAIEQTNSYGFQDKSTSNTIVLKQLPLTYIANAFAPEGINNVFKPVNSFVNTENYLFVVYSRAGQIIFKTNNPYEGWDGTVNGVPATVGVYPYRLYYTFPDGTPYEKIGSATLIR